MKRILILVLTVFAIGCNSVNKAGTVSGTSMDQGTWTVTGNLQCAVCGSSAPKTYKVVFVTSPCTVTTPVGAFSVQGPACFVANNNTGKGSISGTGIPNSPEGAGGNGVLIGAPSNPVPTNATINMIFVSGSKHDLVEFIGNATIANGKVTGTGSCSANTPICQDAIATFSGIQQ